MIYLKAFSQISTFKNLGSSGIMKINLKKLIFLLSIMTFLFIILAILFFIKDSHQIETFTITKAEIIKVILTSKSDGVQYYKPLLKFKDNSGEEFQCEPKASSTRKAFQEGSFIEIYYNPANPSDLFMNTFTTKWFGVIASGGFAFFSLISVFICFCYCECFYLMRVFYKK